MMAKASADGVFTFVALAAGLAPDTVQFLMVLQ